MALNLRKFVGQSSTTSAGMLSLLELIAVAAIFVILTGIIWVLSEPDEARKKARDVRRISDMAQLSSIMEQYIADHNNLPPDIDKTLRTSTIASSSASVSKANGTGWIPVNLSGYLERLPVDPKNSGTYVYRYYRDGVKYQIDAALEYYTERMQNTKDGGNDNCHYEVGNGADTISLSGSC